MGDSGQPVISPIRKKKGGNTQSVGDHEAEKKQVLFERYFPHFKYSFVHATG